MENPLTKQFKIQCDVSTLENIILSSQKGKFLLSRALPLSQPSHCFFG
jgi:hypothetical protein